MNDANNFSSSLLITPERLEREVLDDLFRRRPEWAQLGGFPTDEDDAEQNVFVVRVGDKHPLIIKLNPWSLACVFELTRFGGSVTTNTNSKAGDPKAIWYAKLTRSGTEDNTPLSRIVVAAGAGVQVIPGEDRGDLHPASLTTRAGRTPASKDAREKALSHARTAAEKHAPGVFDVNEYLANLHRLFAEHDRVLEVTVVDDY